MSIFSRLVKQKQRRDISEDILRMNKYFYSVFKQMGWQQPIFPVADMDAYIKKGYGYNAEVYAIINLITRGTKNVEWKLYEVKNEKAFRNYKAFAATATTSKDMFFSNVLRTKALVEVEKSDLLDLIEHPNNQQNWITLIENLSGFKLTTGNSYLYGVAPDGGKNEGLAKELYVLPSQNIEINYSGEYWDPIGGYSMVYGSRNKSFEPTEVMHSYYWNPLYQGGQFLYGLSPLQAAMRTLTSSNEADTSRVAGFQNHGAMGILSSGATNPEQEMSDDEAEALSKAYKQKFGGSENYGKALFTNALVNWQQIGLSPVDLDILNSKKFDLRALCNVYGIQSQLLNDPENKTYNNMMEAKKSLYTDAIIPLLNDLRDDLNKWDIFIPAYSKREGKEYYFAPDYSNLAVLQIDMETMSKWVTDLVKNGIINRNEGREILRFEESEDNGMTEFNTLYSPTKVGAYIQNTQSNEN